MNHLRVFLWSAMLVVLTLLVGKSSAQGQAFVFTDRVDYAAGDTVLVSGFGWEPGESVSLTFNEEPMTHDPVVLVAPADDLGRIASREFVVTEEDAGTRFTLDAVGQTSGFAAQTTFTDSPWIQIAWTSVVPGQVPHPVHPGETATYVVNIKVQAGAAFQVNLRMVSALPSGASGTFFPNPVTVSGSQSLATSTLTVTTSSGTPLGCHAFRFRAEKVGATTDYYEETAYLSVRSHNVSFKPLIAPRGQEAGGMFGWYAAGAGDFNADGVRDFVVTSDDYNDVPGAGIMGKASVFFGGTNLDDVPDLVLTSGSLGDRFGDYVIGGTDLNGDQHPDIVVGAPSHAGYTGRAYVFYGGPNPDGNADLVLTGPYANSQLGSSLASTDFNNDGFEDLLVGAAWGGDYYGRVFLYYGGPGFDGVPDLTFTGPAYRSQFGAHLICMDLNGDGVGDMMSGGGLGGTLSVFFGGSPPNTSPDLVLNNPGEPFRTFPGYPFSCGDINGDGFEDLFVGISGRQRGYVWFGGPSVDAVFDFVFTADYLYFARGGSVGDLNGDGYGDFCVGTCTADRADQTAIYFGGPILDSVPDLIINGECPNDNFGYETRVVGDVNGDGNLEVVMGARLNDEAAASAGKAYVCSLIPAVVSVDGLVSADCDGPRSGVTTTLVDGSGDTHSTATGPDGRYSFAGIPRHGSGTISITVPGGYDPVSPAGGTTPIMLGMNRTIDFSLACIPGYTRAGTNVVVCLPGPTCDNAVVTVTFVQVTTAGVTSVATAGTGPPPRGFRVGQPPVFYDLQTTAVTSGPVDVCIDYSAITFGNENKLELFHREAGDLWVMVTTSRDPVQDIICGRVSSLSTFAICEEIPDGTIAGRIAADCPAHGTGVPGVTVTATRSDNTVIRQATTGGDGSYCMVDVPIGEYSMGIAVPDGYTAETTSAPATVIGGETTTIDFALACVFVDVTGTVTSDCGGVLPGITVDLSVSETDFRTTVTNSTGGYAFQHIRYTSVPGDISLVPPLGLRAVWPPEGQAEVLLTEDRTIDFGLACLEPLEPVRSLGYWKHQASVHLNNKGKAQETRADMEVGYPQAIFSHFHENGLNPLAVEGVTHSENPDVHVPITLTTLANTLSVSGGRQMLDRAKQHFLPLLLNIVSGKLMTYSVVSADGRTASQAVQHVASLILDGNPANDELAKDIAETICNAMPVPAGMIPDGYQPNPYSVDVSLGPVALQVRPNPAPGPRMFVFGLAGPKPVRLEVFDVSGRRVATLLDGTVVDGVKQVAWDGAGVTPGIYFARLEWPGGLQTAKFAVLAR